MPDFFLNTDKNKLLFFINIFSIPFLKVLRVQQFLYRYVAECLFTYFSRFSGSAYSVHKAEIRLFTHLCTMDETEKSIQCRYTLQHFTLHAIFYGGKKQGSLENQNAKMQNQRGISSHGPGIFFPWHMLCLGAKARQARRLLPPKMQETRKERKNAHENRCRIQRSVEKAEYQGFLQGRTH
ncbi:hypothetical protein LJC24_05630 [Desulfococcaceae bacterium OttesenSCG-928-F15]|nr:hypothetical protein [Desulfococcaceae bacterium OttesenSCG-928-F15]